MTYAKPCPECGQNNLFCTQASSGGGYAPNYLPGLGGFIGSAKFEIVVCADCGLTRFFATPKSRSKLAVAKNLLGEHFWKRV